MKMRRSMLKELVKECLVEILSEGIGYDDDLVETRRPAPRDFGDNSEMIEKMQKRKRMLNEKITYSEEKSKPNQDHLVNGVTNDPVMAEIFRDTAQTTLMEQGMSNNARPSFTPGGGAAAVAHENDPSDIFSGAENWATLAFSSGKKNS